MIDLHTHVLPGVDDGAADLIGSLAMAEIAANDGVRVLVATPHVRDDHPAVVPAELAARVADLNASIRRYDLDVEVVPGGEVDLRAALELDDVALRQVTLGQNGRDLLIETPHGPLTSVFEALLDDVRARGLRVTLAHPELNDDLQAEPERLGRLAHSGVLVQITASSLNEPKRSPARALAWRAVQDRWVHAVASDAHAPRWRSPTLGTQLERASRARADLRALLSWAAREGPEAILAGAPVPAMPAAGRRGWPGPWRR